MFKKLIVIFLIPFFFSCSKKQSPGEQKPVVLVTIAPYAYFVEKIAVDTVEVQTLIPQNTNIHVYEPTPKLVEKSHRARIWFRIQEPFEKKIVAVFKETNPKMEIVDLQQDLPLLSGSSSVELGGCGHIHGQYDLHTWLSPKLALKQARLISEKLIALFPEYTALYQKNFNNLAKDLQSLEKDLSLRLAPFKGTAFLTSHPSLGYFARDFELIQLSVECEGKDPRPKDVEEILNQTQKYSVRCVLLQQGFNNRGTSLIGKKLQIPSYFIDPFAKDYLKNMRQIAEYIAK